MPVYEVTSPDVADPTKFGSPTALAVRAGDFLFISGTVAWDVERRPVGIGDVKAQTRHVIKSMQALLEKEGGGLNNVVKVTFFLMDIRHKAAVWEVRKEMFGDARPASTLVEVTHLVDSQLLLEVEAVAYFGK
jgi:enamine deaminase RidA (YjgF/YER057c/UK114 family)